MLRRIGILGGMGPEATLMLMRRVLDAVPARDDADHIPLLVDQNPQVPSRIKALIEGTGADPVPVLAEMAKRLEGAGAEALAMPCNTAHHYADAIRGAVGIPFLDMVGASAAIAKAAVADGAPVGILASPAVRKVGLFDAALAAEGLNALYPSDEASLLATIKSVKSDGPTDSARAALRQASGELLKKGARVQLIACTEFSLMADALATGTIGMDSLDILVAEIVAFSTGSSGADLPSDGTSDASHRSGGARSTKISDQQGKDLLKC